MVRSSCTVALALWPKSALIPPKTSPRRPRTQRAQRAERPSLRLGVDGSSETPSSSAGRRRRCA
eukprot:7708793-Alexandrium_andersonii.AAC.1